MIVVDTNVLAYAVMPGEHQDATQRLAARDARWIAPRLWRHELRNVLVTAMRTRELTLAGAIGAFDGARRLVADAQVEPTTEECLELAGRGGVSAYDAEFVFVAERLDLLLVTGDRRLVKAFPGRVALLQEVAG